MAMADKTVLVFPGRKAPVVVPRFVKRLVQIALSVAATGALVFLLMLGGNFLQTKTTIQKVGAIWYAFAMRSDIITVSILTATVTVLLVYWMRALEKR